MYIKVTTIEFSKVHTNNRAPGIIGMYIVTIGCIWMNVCLYITHKYTLTCDIEWFKK